MILERGSYGTLSTFSTYFRSPLLFLLSRLGTICVALAFFQHWVSLNKKWCLLIHSESYVFRFRKPQSLASVCCLFGIPTSISLIKGVLYLWALFLKTLCIFSKNKPHLDKVSYGSGQRCSTELKNYSFTSVEAIVVKLQRKMCENQYFPCFEP